MFKPLRKEDPILHEKPFLDFEVPFNMVHRIAGDPDALLLRSEDSRIIIAQSNPEMPMWIWVDPGHMNESIDRVIREMDDTFRSREITRIVGTPEFLEALASKYPCACQKEMALEAYECRAVKISQTSATVTVPSLSDLDVIADFCAGFLSDALGVATTAERQLANAETSIRSGNLYVLKAAGEIVAMSSIAHRTERHARINNVYTPPSQRKKGYASLLVADLTLRILSEGLIPVLYTDLSNETSNRIYREIGYMPRGKVDQCRIWNIR